MMNSALTVIERQVKGSGGGKGEREQSRKYSDTTDKPLVQTDLEYLI